MSFEQKRRRSRVNTEIEATIDCQGQRASLNISNLSLKGVYGETHANFLPNKVGKLIIKLSNKESITIDSKVVRCADQHIALEFLRMDEDSFSHLRQLVRAYSEDPDQIDNELAEPAFDPEEQ